MVIGLPLGLVMGFRQEGPAPAPPPASNPQPEQDQHFSEQLRSIIAGPSARSGSTETRSQPAAGERRDPGAAAGIRQSPGAAAVVASVAPAAVAVAARLEAAAPAPLPALSYPAPPVPPGVVNPDNLYNDVYGDLPPLAWNDPEFQARLNWVQSQVPFNITSWSSDLNPSPFSAPVRTSTMFHAEVPGGSFDFDVRSLMQNPELVAYRLKTIQNPQSNPPLTPFPGRLAVQPPTAKPMGEPWLDPSFGGRTMFRATPETSYAPGEVFETPEGRYQKVQFGLGDSGQIVEAWELIYRR